MKRENRRGRGRGRAGGKAARVLVYGESINDTSAIRELACALNPSLDGRVHARRQPIVLIRDAPAKDVGTRAGKIVAAVRAEQVAGPVCGVIAHEDCDDVEPADSAMAEKIERALAELGVEVHAAVPAWELEAWWFLFPEAVAAVRKGWREPDDHVGKRVGLIQNAKEELARCVRPRGKGAGNPKPYTESDSPAIAKAVREMGLADKPRGKSASYDRFRKRVLACNA